MARRRDLRAWYHDHERLGGTGERLSRALPLIHNSILTRSHKRRAFSDVLCSERVSPVSRRMETYLHVGSKRPGTDVDLIVMSPESPDGTARSFWLSHREPNDRPYGGTRTGRVRHGLIVLQLPVQSGQDRRRASTYRGVLWAACAFTSAISSGRSSGSEHNKEPTC
jgi:hypothetical protein